MLDFLEANPKRKTVRTTLYGDQEFTLWEMEILHTPIVQRLYHLKQLGFADKVFPDAVHSRFNHILGVAEMAERMVGRVEKWLRSQRDRMLTFSIDRTSMPIGPAENAQISGDHLADLLHQRCASIRLMGLLHDVTHAAFGHTLEDEVRIFTEKHDDTQRQLRFFDALTAQLFYIWLTETRVETPSAEIFRQLSALSIDRKQFRAWAEELNEYLPESARLILRDHLRELEIAFRLLLRLEFVHDSEVRPVPEAEALFVADAIAIIDPNSQPADVVLHRDVFMIDMVGNTICADLLDYGRRDASNAGLKVQFDERLIRYLTVVTVDGDLSPTHSQCLRLAIQFFTDKMRHDVLSEMSNVLKARYVINERVLYHPTKCAAGAILGSAAQLLGIAEVPSWVQVLGDAEFMAELTRTAEHLRSFCGYYQTGDDYVIALSAAFGTADYIADFLHKCLRAIVGRDSHVLSSADLASIANRASAARRLCWNLAARRFPKLAFRLRSGLQHSGGATDETLAKKYSDPIARYQLERRVEERANLPAGSIAIHCPRPRTAMKLAEVLVVGADMSRVAKLRDVSNVSHDGLKPYEREIRAIEDMYLSIWQMHVFIESSWFDKQPVVSWILERELGFPNDQLLTEELSHQPGSVYRILACDL
jgi:HD superfamily phosphohydrolase